MKSIYSQVRKTIDFHHSVFPKKMENDYYRLDRSSAINYFDIHPTWKKKIQLYFQTLRDQKEQAVSVDICGRAHGESLGSHKSYSFSINPSDICKIFAPKSQVFFSGDIFNSNNFAEFLTLIKDDKPALVTFEPVAGLQTYGPEIKIEGAPQYKEITYNILAKRLCDIISIVRPGGYVYLEKPFQFDADHFINALSQKPKNQFTLCLAMKKIARKMKCKIEISPDVGGPYFLIKKPIVLL